LYQLLPIFQKLKDRKVRVVINTRDPSEHDDERRRGDAHRAIATLQHIGVQVLYTGGHHRKLVIIDRCILYEGSLNVLSQNISSEVMRRIESVQLAWQMAKFVDVDSLLRCGRNGRDYENFIGKARELCSNHDVRSISGILKPMMAVSGKQKRASQPTRPRWLYFVGVAILICFALTLVPGGQAMPILGFYIAGWAFCIWLFRRYKWVRILVTIGFILLALGVIFSISAGQAANLLNGN